MRWTENIAATALGLVLATAACGPTTATPVTCETTCIADPRPHCIADAPCVDDADCPSGMSCDVEAVSRDRGGGDAIGACPAPEAGTCRWFAPAMDPQALITGFVTRTMELHVTSASTPSLGLAWVNPPDAGFVACAVFTCNPVIRERMHRGSESDDPPTNQTTLWRIANADACVFQLQVADTSRSSLRMVGATLPQPPAPCMSDTVSHRVVDFLAAGCWAYDSNRVIAASELMPVAAADFAQVTSAIPDDAACAEENDECYDEVHGFYGACVAGCCQPRCAVGVAQDCELAAHRLRGEAFGASCSWECRPVPTSLAGVCVRTGGKQCPQEVAGDD